MCTRRYGAMLHQNNRLILLQLHIWLCLTIMYLILVQPEVKMVFPNHVDNNVQEAGVCLVKAWPPLISNYDMDVSTDNNCPITKGSIKIIDMYSTAIFFTLDNINSSCRRVSCWTQLDTKTIDIATSK